MAAEKSRKIFGQMKSFLDKYTTSNQYYMNLIELGDVEESDTLGAALHREAVKGNRRALKKILQSAICVDYPNDKGQSPLFCACARNVENTALLLLRHGANPNEKSFDGLTPTHAVCYMANVRLLGKLIEVGADLRLHDNEGKTVRDWAELNPDPGARNRMIDFLDRTHVYAMTFCGDSVSLDRFTKYARRAHQKTSLMEIMKMKTGSDTSFNNLKRVHSMGFGKVYLGSDQSGGIISVIPMISELVLYAVDDTRFETGSVSYMEKMTWLKTTVTVKQVNPDVQHSDGIDLLITDAEYLGKIRHPNVLLLMAICQSVNFDSLMLVFENIKNCNLFHFLHEKGHRMTYSQEMNLVLQVSSAMEFIHSQSLIHCGLSSLAIYLVSENYIKVGNFEFMVESIKANMGRISSVSSVPHGQNLYNWMAPELIAGKSPCFSSDVYSFCSIVWELFSGELPWRDYQPEAIRQKVVDSGKTLNLNVARLPLKLRTLVGYGLVHRHDERLQKFTNILEWLSPDTYGTDSKGKNRSANFATQRKQSSSSSHSSSAADDDMAAWTQDNLCFSTRASSLEHGDSSLVEKPATLSDSETRNSLELSVEQSNDILLDDSDSNSPSPVTNKMTRDLKVKPASHFSHQWPLLKSNPGSACLLHHEANKLGSCGDGERASTLPSDFISHSQQKTPKDCSVNEADTPPKNYVKTLTSSFQQRLNQHRLRQAILKGSMAPKGSTDSESLSELGPNDSSLNKDTTKLSSVDLGNLSSTPVVKCSSTPKCSDTNPAKPQLPLVSDSVVNRARNALCELYGDHNKGDNNKGDYKRLKVVPKVKTNLVVTDDRSRHQAFLDELQLVHSRIVSSSGADYQSPIIQVCEKNPSDSGIGPSCPKSDVPAEGAKESSILDGFGDSMLNSLTEGFLDDSFWDLLPASQKPEHVGDAGKHDFVDAAGRTKEVDAADKQEDCNVAVGQSAVKACGDKIMYPHAAEHKDVTTSSQPDLHTGKLNQTFSYQTSHYDTLTSVTQETSETLYPEGRQVSNIEVLKKSESGGDNLGEDVNMKAGDFGSEFDFLEYYIDDDFDYTEKPPAFVTPGVDSRQLIESTLGCTTNKEADFRQLSTLGRYADTEVDSRQRSTLGHYADTEADSRQQSTLGHYADTEADSRQRSTLGHYADTEVDSRQWSTLGCTIDAKQECDAITREQQEKASSSAWIFEKPPIVPCKFPTNSNGGLHRGNMSQSALTDEDKVTRFPPKRSKSEKDVVQQQVQVSVCPRSPLFMRAGNTTSKVRDGVPAKTLTKASTSASVRYGHSDPSLSCSGVEVDKRNVLDKDDDTLVEVDGASLEEDVLHNKNIEPVTPVERPAEREDQTSAAKAIFVTTAQTQTNSSTFSNNIAIGQDQTSAAKAIFVTTAQTQANSSTFSNNIATGQSSMPQFAGRTNDDDDADIWVSTQLRYIQEKIQRRKNKIDMAGSDDDIANDIDSELNKSSSDGTEQRKQLGRWNAPENLEEDPVLNFEAQTEEQEYVAWGQGVSCGELQRVISESEEKKSVATSTTGLHSKKHKQKSSHPHHRKSKEDRISADITQGRLETRPPSILRKNGQHGNICRETGPPSALTRMRSNLSTSHGSRSADRVISFKDLRESEDPPCPDVKELAGPSRPVMEETLLTRTRPVPAERSLVDHGHYSSTVTTWLERHNFEDTSTLNSPQLCKDKKPVSRQVNKLCQEASTSNSKQSIPSKASTDRPVTSQRKCCRLTHESTSQHSLTKKLNRSLLPEEDLVQKDADHLNGLLSRVKTSETLAKTSLTNCSTNEHYVTFQLETPMKQQSKATNAMKRSSTGLHRFYIPRDMWSNGCKTRLDVRTSPTHPDCQRVTTTALNTRTGEIETLMDQTICSDRLRTTIQID
ncbi:uncharacterized protein LOC106060335 [Biomphalaria glabrata]|uniref:Uncharacterized protein LOC106060335 n=1 Tax=Biomphalaria glabrata TaxID=6526 RepID=A0A9W2ZS84_BIOGL|nr:uncharacterized protein LOC106060335 [Biomphalaria glabrata]